MALCCECLFLFAETASDSNANKVGKTQWKEQWNTQHWMPDRISARMRMEKKAEDLSDPLQSNASLLLFPKVYVQS